MLSPKDPYRIKLNFVKLSINNLEVMGIQKIIPLSFDLASLIGRSAGFCLNIVYVDILINNAAVHTSINTLDYMVLLLPIIHQNGF